MSLRLLLVDDESMIRRLASRMLEGQEVEITMASSATEAKEKFSEAAGGFDVVLCDHNLPDQPGEQLIEDLRTQSPDLPVVFTSGYSLSTADAERTSFIGKPFSKAELIQSIFATAGRDAPPGF